MIKGNNTKIQATFVSPFSHNIVKKNVQPNIKNSLKINTIVL